MTDTPSQDLKETRNALIVTSSSSTPSHPPPPPGIQIEIVSEEEMALLEAALAATRSINPSPVVASSSASSSPIRSSSLFQNNSRSIQSISALSNRSRLLCGGGQPDMEDLGNFRGTQKKNRAPESFLRRFRKSTGLYVTDITSAEWCEKKTEFFFQFGRKHISKAIKAGLARHVELEEEVVTKVRVRVDTQEDVWALKFMNFMTGVNQLLFQGLTRELPLIGFVEGVWITGIVDEIRMPEGVDNSYPILVDTKTRGRDTLPAEPQKRNGRLQLMCYKCLWDNLVLDNFPTNLFYNSFSLNPNLILSAEIRKNTSEEGFPAQTLDDIMRYYRNTCSLLLPADKQMMIRYELRKDNSILSEDIFEYDPDWLKSQIQKCLEFWKGEREATYTPEEERWKCWFCQYSDICPASNVKDRSSPGNTNNPDSDPI